MTETKADHIAQEADRVSKLPEDFGIIRIERKAYEQERYESLRHQLELAVQLNEARAWAARWKRAAKFNRRGWLFELDPELFRGESPDWWRRRMRRAPTNEARAWAKAWKAKAAVERAGWWSCASLPWHRRRPWRQRVVSDDTD